MTDLSQSKVVAGPSRGAVTDKGGVSMGAVLIDSGRLTTLEAEQILRLQREQGLRFGEAGLRLGLLTQADVDFALSRQFDYPYLASGTSAVSESVVAAYQPRHPVVERLREIRTQLMLRWFTGDPGRKGLAILSAARKEGRSFVAANLAVLFSQLGQRTILVDADMRHPVQHELFGLDNRVGLSALLSGRGGPDTIQRIPGLLHLSVIPAGTTPPNPHELLARPVFAKLLEQLAEQVDVILVDSPATSECADAQMIAVRAGGSLIVVRKDASRLWRVQGVSQDVSDARATVVGAVLNDF
jgi:protein-tyrosine kinase